MESAGDFSEDYEPMEVLVSGKWYTSLDYNTLLKWDNKKSMTMKVCWESRQDSSIEWLITYIDDKYKNIAVF